jgi:RimJ/RimL family protein N-acetyltransferase
MPAARDDLQPIHAARVDLVSISAAAMERLLEGDREATARLLGAAIPAGWPDGLDRSLLETRLGDLRTRPQDARWLLRAIIRRDPEALMVGHAGFHGAPGMNALDQERALELGYAVFQPHRRQGYGGETVAALIGWAATRGGTRCFIASIAPGNAASIRTVSSLGFRPVGRRWDDEDGLEVVFRLELPSPD